MHGHVPWDSLLLEYAIQELKQFLRSFVVGPSKLGIDCAVILPFGSDDLGRHTGFRQLAGVPIRPGLGVWSIHNVQNQERVDVLAFDIAL